MTTTRQLHSTEAIPAMWDANRDAFFRIVAPVFAPRFLFGAGVLLASYDDDQAELARNAQ
jgi:hypothetical protein